MSDALYLADVLNSDPKSVAHHYFASAELRRLHAEVERITLNGTHSCHAECQRPVCRLTRERDALLEALKFVIRGVPDTWEGVQKARAAIKAVEEA